MSENTSKEGEILRASEQKYKPEETIVNKWELDGEAPPIADPS